MKVASVQHSHAEMTVSLAKALKIRRLKNLAFVVKKVEPVYRLRIGHNRIVKPERAQSPKRVGAQAETCAQRLQFARLLENLDLPAKEPKPLGKRKSRNPGANDDCPHDLHP